MIDLFLPLENGDFLVPGERVYYDRRYHSAILLQPAFELMAVLVLVLWLNLDIGMARTSIAVLIVLAAIWVLGRLVLKVRRSVRRSMFIAGIVAAIAYALSTGLDAVAWTLVIGFAIRFGLRWLRWAYYRRLLVTDRRVIEIDGLVGSSVATMPLFRITDALLARSPAAELLGYALFKIESAGQDQALGRINFLDGADEFHSLVIQLSTTAKSDEPLVDDGAALDRML